jgi:hypothetical protein
MMDPTLAPEPRRNSAMDEERVLSGSSNTYWAMTRSTGLREARMACR